MFSGRSAAQKKAMIEELTAGFVKTCGGTAQSVQIVITDVDKGDWGSGGVLCSEKFPD
jgi:4-oxalocrotonate tautomerase